MHTYAYDICIYIYMWQLRDAPSPPPPPRRLSLPFRIGIQSVCVLAPADLLRFSDFPDAEYSGHTPPCTQGGGRRLQLPSSIGREK